MKVKELCRALLDNGADHLSEEVVVESEAGRLTIIGVWKHGDKIVIDAQLLDRSDKGDIPPEGR